MRVSIVSILLAGGMLALGACSTSVESRNLMLAERAAQCEQAGAEATSAGRESGEARRDNACRRGQAGGVFDRSDRNVVGAGAARSRAIDRSLQGRIN